MSKKLKLTSLSETEMKKTKGGQHVRCCVCGCGYVNCGGSSSSANRNANDAEGFMRTCMGDCC